MIVTVTLNPALHVRYDADRFELGTANRVSRVRHQAGGRGLAVARLLQTFGHEVVAAGLAGGSSGELIRIELAKAGVATQFTRIGAESRRVVRITDGSAGQVTSLQEPSPYITTEELGRLAADYRALLDGATAVVLCGSLPTGLPAETYGSLTSYATSAGVPVILDADGSALRYGASSRTGAGDSGRFRRGPRGGGYGRGADGDRGRRGSAADRGRRAGGHRRRGSGRPRPDRQACATPTNWSLRSWRRPGGGTRWSPGSCRASRSAGRGQTCSGMRWRSPRRCHPTARPTWLPTRSCCLT